MVIGKILVDDLSFLKFLANGSTSCSAILTPKTTRERREHILNSNLLEK
jgi:hypothetical protein